MWDDLHGSNSTWLDDSRKVVDDVQFSFEFIFVNEDDDTGRVLLMDNLFFQISLILENGSTQKF